MKPDVGRSSIAHVPFLAMISTLDFSLRASGKWQEWKGLSRTVM